MPDSSPKGVNFSYQVRNVLPGIAEGFGTLLMTQTISSYRQALRGMRRGLGIVGLLSAAISLLMLTGSIYMLQVYDRVLNSGSIPTLIALFGIVVMLYGFLAFYDGLRMRLLSRLGMQLDAQLAPAAFRADLAAFRHQGQPGAGSLRQRLDLVRGFLGGPAILAMFDLPFTVLFLGVLFLIHPILGWMTVFGMALAGGLALINRAVLKSPMAAAREAEEAQGRFAESARQAAPVLAALGMAGAVTKRWTGLHAAMLGRQQSGTEPSEVLTALSRALRMLLQSALLTAGAWLVIDGAMSGGSIVAASILSGRALGPVDQLIGHWRQIAALREAHDRLSRDLGAANATQSVELPPLQGALDIEELTTFAATRPGSRLEPAKVLDSISFSLAPGDGLGIVGASASGKSTLARMIVGAALPEKGEVRFDGATARQWDPDRLGRQIGYLPQRIDLLPGSLRDNIARFDPLATDAEVIRAAKSAGVHDMILRLPDGYSTQIGAEVPLSGGQIQRIGLARALYGRPKLLVLDEPNAHLDQAGEAALARCLVALRKDGATVIVLAHRAGALAAVDRLMVMEAGRIVQDGPRDEVLTLLGGGAPLAAPRIAAARLPDGVSIRAAGKPERRLYPAEAANGPAPAKVPLILNEARASVQEEAVASPLFRARPRKLGASQNG